MSGFYNDRDFTTPYRISQCNDAKQHRRSASMHLYKKALTPAVKSLFALDPIDSQLDLLAVSSAQDKLVQWKRRIEQQLNRIYFLKLREIQNLLQQGQSSINIKLTPIPSFESLVTVINSSSASDDHHWDSLNSRLYNLSSNNVLLCVSDEYALIYDHIQWKLIRYHPYGYFDAFYWDMNEYGEPCDLTYSFHLRRFIVVTDRGLFIWSWHISGPPLHVDRIKPIAGNRLWTVASTAEHCDVFLLFKQGSYIERWQSHVDPISWQHIQRWSHHELFDRSDQRIRCIRMTSTYVAWTVETISNYQWRVDLLDYQLQLIHRGITIDHLDRSSSCLLSNYFSEQFLIVDSNGHSLFIIDQQGSIKLKTDPLFNKRLRNAVLMVNLNQTWLVLRLEKPHQLYFLPLFPRNIEDHLR